MHGSHARVPHQGYSPWVHPVQPAAVNVACTPVVRRAARYPSRQGPRLRPYGPQTRSYYARSGYVPLIKPVLGWPGRPSSNPTRVTYIVYRVEPGGETRYPCRVPLLSVPDQTSIRTWLSPRRSRGRGQVRTRLGPGLGPDLASART